MNTKQSDPMVKGFMKEILSAVSGAKVWKITEVKATYPNMGSNIEITFDNGASIKIDGYVSFNKSK